MLKKKECKKLLVKTKGKIGFWMTTFGLMLKTTAIVRAEGKDRADYNFLTGGGNGAFNGLNQTIKKTGASAYPMFMTVGVIGLFIGLIIVALGFILGNSNKKEESKTKLLWILAGGCLIFGAIAIIGIIKEIGLSIQ